jgi:predicted nucleic acid-binding protein
MIIGIDTNILVYAEGVNGSDRQQTALNLLRRLPGGACLLPVQTLGELYNVLVRKAGQAPAHARTRVLSWSASYPTADTSALAFTAAVDLAATHQLGIWDSLIIAVAAENGCQLLLSEDLQDGFRWNSVTIVNPIAAVPSPLLEAVLIGDTP